MYNRVTYYGNKHNKLLNIQISDYNVIRYVV